MKDVFDLIECLQRTPVILQYLLEDIPEEVLKVQRKTGKWSIHEHACHLAQADQMILSRFHTFVRDEFPDFASYMPGKTDHFHMYRIEELWLTKDAYIS